LALIKVQLPIEESNERVHSTINSAAADFSNAGNYHNPGNRGAHQHNQGRKEE